MLRNLACFAFVVAFAALAWGDAHSDFEEIIKTCLVESNLSEEELSKLKSAKEDEDLENANENVKCIAKCVMEKEGAMKEGVVNADFILQRMKTMPIFKDHEAEAEKTVEECKNEKGANDCDTAFKIIMCFRKHKAPLLAA